MIRSAREADLSKIVEIENISFSRPWSKEALESAVCAQSGENPVRAAVYGEQAQGYIIYSLICGEAEIFNIAVHPESRGRGIGYALMLCALHEADAAFLEVRKSNSAAIGLYEKCGFKAAGERKKYYENGEDAVLMTWSR